ADQYLDYQAQRPLVQLQGGVARTIVWPLHECLAASFSERDLVVVRGTEPSLRWRGFCDAIIEVAREMGCDTVVTFGALIGNVPHTRLVRVTGSTSDKNLVHRLGLQTSRYEGPTGLTGVLHD